MKLPTLGCLIISIIIFIIIDEAQTVSIDQRIDCDPGHNSDQDRCWSRGCLFDNMSLEFKHLNPTVPQCYYPDGTGYIFESGTNPTIILKKSSNSVKNPYGKDFEYLQFSYQQIGAGIHATIAPKDVIRFRPPVPIDESPNLTSEDTLRLELNNNGAIFSFQVKRDRNGVNIWDTSIGGLLYADKFIQIATFLPSDKIYGFGENIHHEMKHNFSRYTTWGMNSRDQPPDSVRFNTYNYYGVHPFYLGLEFDGSAHGVFIFNSNPQEVTTGPSPHLIYRTIGGQLDIFFFPGPTPEQVIQQYQQVIGTPFLPAYWALGFQLSRWGYGNLTVMQRIIQKNIDAGIPLDVAFVDIDYMDNYKDFSLDLKNWEGLPNYTNWLHNNGMHLTLIFDPAIVVDYSSFQRGIQDYNASFIEWPRYDLAPQYLQDIYSLTKGTKIMLGSDWPERNVAFPDFLDPFNNTRDWWANEYVIFHNKVPFDGIWVDMNEPSNFATSIYNNSELDIQSLIKSPTENSLKCPYSGPDSEWDNPPYPTINVWNWRNNSYLCKNTLCMLASTMRGNGRFYDTKNLYGWSEVRATANAIRVSTGKRGQVITKSTFPSSGRYGGHWLGDCTSRWEDLRTSIIGAQEFNLFGIPFVGSDICGFFRNTNEELCLRWHQVGAFHSFSRNHNAKPPDHMPQDPAQWPSVAQASRKANLFRYRHLPYLFSLHFSASLKGGTVVRPVFFEFHKDNNTHNLSHQFLWGSSLLIVPVIHPGATTVTAYLPTETIWYSVYDDSYGAQVKSGYQEFQAPLDYLIPVFVRGGSILPRQRPSMTTVASRQNEFQLLIALGLSNQATGELYWDDGESLVPNDDFLQHNYYHFLFDFTVNQQSANLTIIRDRAATNLTLSTLDNIEIFGYPYQPNFKSLILDGNPITIDLQTAIYTESTKVLNITAKGLIDLNKNNQNWVLSWQNLPSKSAKTTGLYNLIFVIYVAYVTIT